MIALDTNIFLYALKDGTAFSEQSKKLFLILEETKLDAEASELVIFETLSFSGIAKSEVSGVRLMLNKLAVPFNKITNDALLLAAQLRREFSFGAMDSIHVATAIESGATHFVTNDKKLLKKSVNGICLISLLEWESLLPEMMSA